ncbi:class I SAM-dependent methyltransferase [bacterium]|nr:class I SAM-dependent methyltransferase [candidate division CSSED10-310 bacterium]
MRTKPEIVSSYTEILGDISSQRTLDVATCDGHFIDILRQGLKQCGRVVGIDISKRFYEPGAAPFSQSNNAFCLMDFTNLAFQPECFDMIVMSNTLQYMTDFMRTIDQILALLRPTGWFLISEMTSDAQTDEQACHRDWFVWYSSITRLLNLDTIQSMLSRHAIMNVLQDLNMTEYQTFIIRGKRDDRQQAVKRYQSLEKQGTRLLDRVTDAMIQSRYRKELNGILDRVVSHGWQFADNTVFLGRKTRLILGERTHYDAMT